MTRLMPIASRAQVPPALMVVSIAVLWSTPAFAEWSCPTGGSPSDVEAQASEAFDEGERLFREGDFAAARVRFRCSFGLFPHPATLYNIAQSIERLGDLHGAIEVYWEYLLISQDDEERAEVEAHVRALQEGLDPEPDDVTEPTEEEAPSSEPEPVPVPESEREPSQNDAEESWLRSRQRLHPAWFWGLLGLTGATAVVMTATGASTLNLADRWIEEGNVDDRDRALSLRSTTDGFLIVLILEAVAALAVGLFTDFDSLRRDEADATR